MKTLSGMTYGDLYVTICNKKKPPVGVGYYYLVHSSVFSGHAAFYHKHELKRWMNERGLKVGKRLPCGFSIAGSYFLGDEMLNTADYFAKYKEMKNITGFTGFGDGFNFKVSYNDEVSSKEDFAKKYQKHCWRHIFDKMNMEKYLTTGVMKDVNQFCEHQSKIPFTVKNVYRMFEVIIGTAEENFKRALVEAVDEFTKHHHENRYHVEGWKTNCGWMLNQKFIVPYLFKVKDYGVNKGNLEMSWGSSGEKMISDLEKVLCNITGTNYDDVRSLGTMVRQFDGLEAGRWYYNGFFEVRGYKKGTAHFKFQDEKIWELLNKKYAEIKGFVLFEGKSQSKYENKQTGRESQKKRNPAMKYKPVSMFE